MSERSIPQGAGGRFHPSAIPQSARGDYADGANRVAVINIDLATARTNKELKIAGNFLWAFDASDLSAEIEVTWNEQSGGAIKFGKGQMVRGVPFTTLFLTNSAQSGKTIKFMYAVEAFQNIEIANPLAVGSETAITQPTNYTGSGEQTIADASTDTISAQSDRHEITISAKYDNVGNIFVRDSAGNAFAELAAGDSITIPGTDELQVRNDAGQTESYYYVEIRE